MSIICNFQQNVHSFSGCPLRTRDAPKTPVLRISVKDISVGAWISAYLCVCLASSSLVCEVGTTGWLPTTTEMSHSCSLSPWRSLREVRCASYMRCVASCRQMGPYTNKSMTGVSFVVRCFRVGYLSRLVLVSWI